MKTKKVPNYLNVFLNCLGTNLDNLTLENTLNTDWNLTLHDCIRVESAHITTFCMDSWPAAKLLHRINYIGSIFGGGFHVSNQAQWSKILNAVQKYYWTEKVFCIIVSLYNMIVLKQEGQG